MVERVYASGASPEVANQNLPRVLDELPSKPEQIPPGFIRILLNILNVGIVDNPVLV